MPVDEDLDRPENADLHGPSSRDDVVSPKSTDSGPCCNAGTRNSCAGRRIAVVSDRTAHGQRPAALTDPYKEAP